MITKSITEVEEDAQRLKEWLNKQPHLPHDIDKEILKSYVYGTKSLEIAKQKLDSYFTYKSKAPHLFNFPGRDPEDEAFKRGSEAYQLFILPNMTPERYIVVMAAFGPDISKFNHIHFVTRTMMVVDMAMLEPRDVEGVVFIADLRYLDVSILPKLSIPTNAFFLPWFEKTIPMKMKRMIFFNAPKFVDVLINTFIKPFLSQKLYNRLVVTSEDFTTLKNYVNDNLLPSDYGGLEKSSYDLNENCLEELRKNKSWFEKINNQVADETKRPPDDKGTYGINGTFRTITVD